MFKVKLKDARINARITQKALAEKLNVAQSTVGGWESGAREPSIDMLDKISKVLDVTISYLLGQVDDPHTSDVYAEEWDDPAPPLVIPAELKDVPVAFKRGADGLTQAELDELAEYAKYLKSKRKYKKDAPDE